MVARRVRDDPRRPLRSFSCSIAFIAPRNLNAPTLWKFSHLRTTDPPERVKVRDVSTGVAWTHGLSRSAAWRTSSTPIAGGGSGTMITMTQL